MDPRGYRCIIIPRIRIISLGNCGVGKSCLIKRYCEQRFVQRYLPTIGIDYGSTTVEVDGRKVSIHFFDTSGNALYEEVRTEFYHDMQGVMLVYDVTDRASFIALDAWLAEIRNNLGSNGFAKLVMVVVGTRSDTGGSVSGRQVSEADGRAWATRHGAKHIVTSAALGTGVTTAFMTLFSEALLNKENIAPNHGPPPFSSKPNNSSSSQRPKPPPPQAGKSAGKPTTNATTKANSNGAKTQQNGAGGSPDTEAVTAINALLNFSDPLQKLQLNSRSVSKEDVNKAYRRLAGLVHPDKCKAERAEEAFKMLAQTRNTVLSMITETAV